jgi:hypothetical protein
MKNQFCPKNVQDYQNGNENQEALIQADSSEIGPKRDCRSDIRPCYRDMTTISDRISDSQSISKHQDQHLKKKIAAKK